MPPKPRFSPTAVLLCAFLPTFSCSGAGSVNQAPEPTAWELVKASAAPGRELPAEFGSPQRIPIDTLGWEDGLHVSRDGRRLYATYIPMDMLSWLINGDSIPNMHRYGRGPTYDMDLATNPTGETYPWYHSDIIYSSRAGAADPFSSWTTSAMKRSVYSEGAPCAVFSDADTIGRLVFTSNENYTEQNNFKIIADTFADPSGLGSFIAATDHGSSPVAINTDYVEDNPHLERLDSSHLVLFFDSPDRPGGVGDIDLWFSTSDDDGVSWSTPAPVSTVNTASKEHQPHLYSDGAEWWLYYSANGPEDKLAIYRRKQLSAGNWDSWGPAILVLSAGNTAGIGEPTLTSAGDLYFIVVYENPDGGFYDRYDADAWFVPHL